MINGRPFGVRALVWAWVRGVHDPRVWSKPCARCGFSGRVHYNWINCVRYKVRS